MSFRDAVITIAFSVERTELSFTLQNNGDDPIKIDWTMVTFIQPTGTSQGVVHKGVKLADRQAPKAPTMIPPKTKIEDVLVPMENIEFLDNEWYTHPLLLDGPAGLQSVGLTFSVFMPMDVGGATRNDTFTFKILSAE